LLLAVLAAGGFEIVGKAAGQERATRVVRVAYPISPNFQEGGEEEQKSGYGYEYLQKIAYYAGWEYEYVYGSFYGLLSHLEAGDVDLMAGVSYTDGRSEQLAYSGEPLGEERFYLFPGANRNGFSEDDLSTINHARIGVHEGCYAVTILENWCEEHDVSCKILTYENSGQCVQALEDGAVDLVADSELHVNDCTPLIFLGKDDYYFCVSTDQPEILAELDQAMSEIKASNFYYSDELRVKYLTNSGNAAIALSEEEQDWLEEQQTIRIGYLNGFLPYCDTDEQTGKATGMLTDLLGAIRNSYGLDSVPVGFDSCEEMQQALLAGEVDAVFPFYGDYNVGENDHVMISDAVIVSSMTMLNSRSNVTKMEVAAVTTRDPFQADYVKSCYPEAELVYYEDMADCIRAVADGDADFAVTETANSNEFQAGDYKYKIQRIELPDSLNISFAVTRGSRNLLAVLNKGIRNGESLISTSLIQHSQMNTDYTFVDFLREYILQVLLFVVIAFSLIIGMLIAYIRLRLRSQKRLTEANHETKHARWDAEHDSLTGLLNRAAFQTISTQLRKASVPLALLIIDVDQFKCVNDTYGHETGDLALRRVATLLERSFREANYVIRYAGDEFVVLILDMYASIWPVLEAKIQRINNELANGTEDVPKLSVSVGAAFSEAGYREELFREADQALYCTKKNGKCGCSFYKKKEGS
jgi:diguanylate cyclase (GGDEF)-like protein